MKNFLRLGQGYGHLSKESRWLYSVFLLFCLWSYVVMMAIAGDRAGWLPTENARYFAGDVSTDMYPKTYAEILEWTHFHLFSIPVFLLILSHIFFMSPIRFLVRCVVVSMGFLGAGLYITAPWLIRFSGTEFALSLTLGRTAMMLSMLVMTVVPVFYLWKKR